MTADRKKEFVRLIEGAARRTSVMNAFGDAVHLMALSLWAPLAPNRAAVEADYGATRRKYEDGDMDAFARALKLVVEELEETREEFLGAILERIGAANKAGGQFLTPRAHVAGGWRGRPVAGGGPMEGKAAGSRVRALDANGI